MDNPNAPSTTELMEQTSFLYGGNAAYIEQLQARYQENPSSVDAEWQAFFKALDDDAGDVKKTAQGASWQKANWPSSPMAISSRRSTAIGAPSRRPLPTS